MAGNTTAVSSSILAVIAFAAMLTWGANVAVAHSTLVPHHTEDFEDLANGRDRRGLIVVVTFVFVALMTTLIVVAVRYSEPDDDVGDTRETQTRLRARLLEVGTFASESLGKPPGDMVRLVAERYAEASGVAPISPGDRMTIGGDVVSVRYERDGENGAWLEIVSTRETAGARLVLTGDGKSSVSTFVMRRDRARDEGKG